MRRRRRAAPDPHTGGPSRFPLVTAADAHAALRRFRALAPERIAVADATGRVLARDVRTTLDLPHFARSYMDGFAVRARDTATTPAPLRIVGAVAMGHPVTQRLRAGETMRIPTGGMLPAGADAILLSNILHDWDEPQCAQLVQRCADALPAGGRLLIHDVFLDDDLAGPLPIALYSAALFTLTEGRAYSAREFQGWLTEAGLSLLPVTPTLVHCAVVGGRK